LVEEEKWFTVIGTVFHSYRFALYTRANRDVSITFSPERSTLEVRLAVQVSPPVCDRGKGEGFSKKIIRGPRV